MERQRERPVGPWREVRRGVGQLFSGIGIPRKGPREAPAHWARRSAALWLMERRNPDPLGGNADVATDIDVVIPVGPRDISVLELALNGLHENLAGPIGAISCIAPVDIGPELRRRYPEVNVIDEEVICGPGLRDKVSRFGARAGWMMQQFVTLSTPEVSEGDAVLVIDADTVLLRKRRFRAGDKTLLLAAEEFHLEYYETLARIWREALAVPLFSCIAHHMCFLRRDVVAMRAAIEKRWSMHWVDAILRSCGPERRLFSEYELYGQWRLRTSPSSTVVRPMRNIPWKRSPGDTLASLTDAVATRAYSVSCHWYL
jgi:Family of unknown function (DUF6492)